MYLVTCTACDFERDLADIEDVLDAVTEHEERFGDDHLVEFELLDQDE